MLMVQISTWESYIDITLRSSIPDTVLNGFVYELSINSPMSLNLFKGVISSRLIYIEKKIYERQYLGYLI